MDERADFDRPEARGSEDSAPSENSERSRSGGLPFETRAFDTLEEPTRHERVIHRVSRNIAVFGIALLVPAFWYYGWAGVIGFASGAALSWVNFRSLTRSVEGLADRVVNQNSREKGGVIVFRFLVRYALFAVVAYAIFNSYLQGFRGFLWGLCVPVAALMAEAIWEGYLAFRR